MSGNKHIKRLSINTMVFQEQVLAKYLPDVPTVEDITVKMIQTIFDLMKKEKVSPATIRSRYATIMAFLRHCYRHKHLKFNPSFTIKKIRKYRAQKIPLNGLALRKMLDVNINYPYCHEFQYYRNKAIIGLLIYAGLRVGEVNRLRKDDIHDGYVNIIAGKGRFDRVVPIQEPLTSWLANYLKSRKHFHSNRLFVGLFKKSQFNRSTVNIIVKNVARAAKLRKKVYAHLLRHSFASQMLKGRVDLEDLRQIMGHQNVEMTAMYAKPDFEMVRDALLANPIVKILGGEK